MPRKKGEKETGRRSAAPRCSEDPEAAAGPDPEEWRSFRAKLIAGGLRLTDAEDGGSAPEPAEREEPARERLQARRHTSTCARFRETGARIQHRFSNSGITY